MTAPRWTDTQLDVIADLYRRIGEVTSKYTFTRPVEHVDLEIVRRELAFAAPGYPVALYFDVNVRVTVRWPDGTRLYDRLMLTIG